MTAELKVSKEMGQGCLVLTFTGFLDFRTAPLVYVAVVKALAEGPVAVLCDLSDVAVDATGASVFLLLADVSEDWPETPIVLCAATGRLSSQLRARRIDRRLAVRGTVAEAIADPGRRPGLHQTSIYLPPIAASPGLARRLLVRACQQWHAERFIELGSLVLSELVTNGVTHARTDLKVRIVYTGGYLRLSVRDRGNGWPRMAHSGEHGSGRRGLPLVATLADAWGVASAEGGGKTIWCVIGDPARRSPP